MAEIINEPIKSIGVVFNGHLRRIATDARDGSLNITITIFENNTNLDGLLALRDKSLEVALVELPELP